MRHVYIDSRIMSYCTKNRNIMFLINIDN